MAGKVHPGAHGPHGHVGHDPPLPFTLILPLPFTCTYTPGTPQKISNPSQKWFEPAISFCMLMPILASKSSRTLFKTWSWPIFRQITIFKNPSKNYENNWDLHEISRGIHFWPTRGPKIVPGANFQKSASWNDDDNFGPAQGSQFQSFLATPERFIKGGGSGRLGGGPNQNFFFFWERPPGSL